MAHTDETANYYAHGASQVVIRLINKGYSATEGTKILAYALATCLANAPDNKNQELNEFWEDAKKYAAEHNEYSSDPL